MPRKNSNIDRFRSTSRETFKQYIEDKGMSRKDIAKEFGVSKALVDKVFRELDLHTTNNRKNVFNFHVFDTIDTEEKLIGWVFSMQMDVLQNLDIYYLYN